MRGSFLPHLIYLLLIADLVLSVITGTLGDDKVVQITILSIHYMVVILVVFVKFILLAQTTYFQAGLFAELISVAIVPIIVSILHSTLLIMPWSTQMFDIQGRVKDPFDHSLWTSMFLLNLASAVLFFLSTVYFLVRLTNVHLYVPLRPSCESM